MVASHSHTFAILLAPARQVHRMTHKHDFEDPAHRHMFSDVMTDPARFYEAEQRVLQVDRDGFPR